MHSMPKAIYLEARHKDWDWAQVQYESSDMATIDIATTIGVSAPAVIAKASKHGWVRNKGQLVAQATAEMIASNRERLSEQRQERLLTIERVNIEMQSKALTSHRKDISIARKICMRLFEELEQLMENIGDLAQVGELLRAPNERGVDRLNDAYHQVLSFPDRTRAIKTLAEALKTLIMLERQAYGIQGALEDPENPDVPANAADPLGWDRVLTKFSLIMEKTTVSAQSPQSSGLRTEAPPAVAPLAERVS